MKNILVIGSTGQIGSELTMKLRRDLPGGITVAGYIPGAEPKGKLLTSGPAEIANVTNAQQIADIVDKYDIDTIYNLAALLSATAEKKAQEAKNQARKAQQEKDEADKKAKAAKAELSSAESKVAEKQSEIDRLKQRIDIEQVVLEGLQSEVEEKRREKDSIKTSDDWMNPALRAVSGYLFNTDKVIKFAIETIQDYAYSGTGGRGGNHGDCFYDNEAFVIKKLMTGLAAIAKTTFQVIGNWLVYVASKIAKFNDWELNRAERGVKSIADGDYDWRIDRFERRQGGGLSR
jgi:hypothetical protein